ncbi:hypothetical protein E2562_009911 [Oryza meyeriana var. granulata]|uniref:Uncharacterized protein n=1 Tax=Oryza meyeriana var. granulata TaxID=110450 RepID=A0A6G1BVU6_9ORYZ|nr:hypothetical protein E2562_009911 [Oryza meyeriana var. granulata]
MAEARGDSPLTFGVHEAVEERGRLGCWVVGLGGPLGSGSQGEGWMLTGDWGPSGREYRGRAQSSAA